MIARANGRHRRRGSDIRVRFGSVPFRSVRVDSAFVSTSNSNASDRDRRSIDPPIGTNGTFGIETANARANANASDRRARE